jgi:acyl-CoA synthetase (NDP forming)
LIVAVADDPAVAELLIFYDEPPELEGDPKISWDAVREGILDGARDSGVPVIVASTLPELLQADSADRMVAAGVPPIAGLRSGIAAAAALAHDDGDPERLREIAGAARATDRGPGRWLGEHDAKQLLRDAGVPVVPGRVARDQDDAVAILAELGAPVAAKLTGDEVRHKSEIGGLALDLVTEEDVRGAHGRLAKLGAGAVLVERHAPAGAELLVSARRDAVVPSLALGLGGVWTEALADAAVIPLPATAARVERALRGLRGAALLTGGRGRPELDVGAVARLAADVGRLLLDSELDLVELNPVVVYEEGAVVVDALARTSVPAASPTAVNQ